jgi:hypothetical protein
MAFAVVPAADAGVVDIRLMAPIIRADAATEMRDLAR